MAIPLVTSLPTSIKVSLGWLAQKRLNRAHPLCLARSDWISGCRVEHRTTSPNSVIWPPTRSELTWPWWEQKAQTISRCCWMAPLDGYTYVEARGGDDVVVGSEANEEIVGGAGDDDLQGGAGDDVLTDSQGTNTLSGGSGDDIINLTGTSTPQGTIDGGEGIDTLRVASDTNFSNISISNVEILDGRGGRTQLTPQEVVIDKGFTTANNITFQSGSERYWWRRWMRQALQVTSHFAERTSPMF